MRLVAVLLVVGIFLVSGCIIKKQLSDCDKPGLTKEEKNICYHVIARSTNNPGICVLIDDIGLRNDCHYQIAQNTGKIEVCDRITLNEVPGDTVLCAACKKSIDPSLKLKLEDCTTS